MNIAIIAGSNHKHATSTQLLRYIARELRTRGADVTLIDLWAQPVPFYSPDNEEMHPNVKLLVDAVAGADGLVFGTPEYHGSISGVLKNAVDYLSGALVAGKPVLSVSSSGGPVGVSSLTQLQTIVRNLHGINSPEWISIGGAKSFAPDGAPADEGTRLRVGQALDYFTHMVSLMRPAAANAM